jgi:hypothetical protein
MVARSGRAASLSKSFDLALLVTASNNSGPNVVRAMRQNAAYTNASVKYSLGQLVRVARDANVETREFS